MEQISAFTMSMNLMALVLFGLLLGQSVDGIELISTLIDNIVFASSKLICNPALPTGIKMDLLRFVAYDKENPDNPYYLKYGDVENLNKSPLKNASFVICIIHGWFGSFEGETMQELKNRYLTNSPKNITIIFFDFKQYHSPYIYTYICAKEIAYNFAEFLKFLVEKGGITIENFHMIGFSLGAHIAGFIGKWLTGYLLMPRITGLDAAGPLYEWAPPSSRLSVTDAKFVDVICTSKFFGICSSIGHANFFVNGCYDQPNCTKGPAGDFCRHTSGPKMYGCSIENPHKYPASKCQLGSDSEPYVTFMGVDADRSPPGNYCVNVTSLC